MAYQYPNVVTYYSRFAPEKHKPSVAEFYRQALPKNRHRVDIMNAEQLWLESEKAYYNVHPLVVPHLCPDDMEGGIMASNFVCPHGNVSFVIRFPQDHNIRELLLPTVSESLIVWQILVADWRKVMLNGKPIERLQNKIHFHIALGNRTKVESGNMIVLECSDNVLLKDAIDRHVENLTERDDSITKRLAGHEWEYRKVISNVMTLTAMIGFIHTDNSGLIEPDILAELKSRYENSKSDEERANMVRKSHKRKGKGYIVGSDLFFMGPQGLQDRKDYNEGGGKERTHAHIRRGHIHLHRYGPGRKLVKGMWQDPVLVRPDLPFKPMENK